MKYLLVSILFLVLTLSVKSQTVVTFQHDASGNRTEKIIKLSKSATTTSFDEPQTDLIEEFSIKIYPNPTKGLLKVEIEKDENIKSCSLKVSSMTTGKVVFNKKATLPTTDIDISNQQFGIYLLTIEINGKMVTWKIIKN